MGPGGRPHLLAVSAATTAISIHPVQVGIIGLQLFTIGILYYLSSVPFTYIVVPNSTEDTWQLDDVVLEVRRRRPVQPDRSPRDFVNDLPPLSRQERWRWIWRVVSTSDNQSTRDRYAWDYYGWSRGVCGRGIHTRECSLISGERLFLGLLGSGLLVGLVWAFEGVELELPVVLRLGLGIATAPAHRFWLELAYLPILGLGRALALCPGGLGIPWAVAQVQLYTVSRLVNHQRPAFGKCKAAKSKDWLHETWFRVTVDYYSLYYDEPWP